MSLLNDGVFRRRSADVGGLQLAMRGQSQGQGWLDGTAWHTTFATEYAEVCASMYRETVRLVQNNNVAHNDLPNLSDGDRVRLLVNLESWSFEALSMTEHELLACVQFLFQVLFRIQGMRNVLDLDMNILSQFLTHIRHLYRWQNHYHNFEHAVDVLQALHCYLLSAGMVPSVALLLKDENEPGGMWMCAREHDSGPLVTCLTPREIFALYLAAIGHDVGHPGFNNPFMKNADAPLSRVYDNQSALEQMHSYLLFMAMRQYGLGSLLDDPKSGFSFRKILKNTVLATDMGIHQAFMNQSEEILDGVDASSSILKWKSTKCTRQIFICQLLLKNADISNPCRPFPVSKRWASALQQEWACQYKFENFLQVQHSVTPSNGPLAEANSQVFFIKHIAKPLIDMTTLALPELRPYSLLCAENLVEWERILEEQKKVLADDSVSVSEFSTKSSSSLPSSSLYSSRLPISSSAVTNISFGKYTSSLRRQRSHMTSITLPTTMSSSFSYTPSLISSGSPMTPNLPDNDYSTAFRLALPRGRSCLVPNSSPSPSSMMMLNMVNPIRVRSGMMNSGSSTLGGASSPGVMLPSGSRSGICGGGSSPLSSCSCSSPCHCSATSPPRSRSPIGQSGSEAQIKMDELGEYRFPPTSSISISSPLAPAPAPSTTVESTVSSAQIRSDTSSMSLIDTHSWTSEDDTNALRSRCQSDELTQDNYNDDATRVAMEEGDGGDDDYELNLQARRVDFHNAVNLGLGVDSLKRKQSRNVLKNSPFGYPTTLNLTCAATVPSSTGSSGGYSFDGLEPSTDSSPDTKARLSSVGSQGRTFRVLQQHNPNRASWCPGVSWVFDTFEPQIKSKEEAKGTIKGWARGRWGSARFQVPISDNVTEVDQGLKSVGRDENGHEGRDIRGFDLVALLPLQFSSSPSTPPRTPPRQVGSLYDRSGTPTPKAKPSSSSPQKQQPSDVKFQPCETEGQKKKRQEKERQKLIDELIKDEEKEKRKMIKRAASMNSLNIGGSNRGAGGTEKDTRSKSKSKKRGKGRK